VDESFLTNTDSRCESGQAITTKGVGRVHLDLHVLLKRAQLLRPVGGDSVRKSLEMVAESMEKMKRRAAGAAGEQHEEGAEEEVRSTAGGPRCR
jgi:hypothetical protein